VVAALAVSGAAVWIVSASLQQDLSAYYTAGAARRLGLDPYVNHAPAPWDGVSLYAHSRFLYPPLAAESFRPLAALPYLAAKSLFTAAAVACWIAGALLAAPASGGAGARGAALSLAAGALYFPLYLHLERGQIDLAILLLLLAAWRWRARAAAAAGAALAAAAAFKPALLGLLPVWAALGRTRAAAWAAAWGAALLAATAAISGPALLGAYATRVLPRASLYGEGGTEEMLLPPEKLDALEGAAAPDGVIVDGRRFAASLWDGPAGASLPRLLAPETPSRWASTLPGAIAIVGLAAAARRARRRGPTAEALVALAAPVAAVVTSPAGWIMGLVLALPLVPLARAAWAAGALRARAAAALGAALAACAIPPPLPGWGALAGTAVVAAAVYAALAGTPRAEAAA
jgi:hypothetical protein